jgi:hypothetical protein
LGQGAKRLERIGGKRKVETTTTWQAQKPLERLKALHKLDILDSPHTVVLRKFLR